ncbi:MAG: hypothetical protein AB7L28_23530 [Kofleriaceae bacterium]
MTTRFAGVDRSTLNDVIGGATSSTLKLGVQVGDRNLGWESRIQTTDYEDCLDYVKKNNQNKRDCADVYSIKDLNSEPTIYRLGGGETKTR